MERVHDRHGPGHRGRVRRQPGDRCVKLGQLGAHLQSNQIDISFGLNPTPSRALVVDFTNPLFYTSFAIVSRPGFTAKTWAELDDPAITIAVDIESTHELIARQMAPHAKIVALRSPVESVIEVQSGRANCLMVTVILALSVKAENPSLGTFAIPTPVLSAPACPALRDKPDNRLRDFLNSWASYNRVMGRVRSWILTALDQQTITAEDIPPEVSFLWESAASTNTCYTDGWKPRKQVP